MIEVLKVLQSLSEKKKLHFNIHTMKCNNLSSPLQIFVVIFFLETVYCQETLDRDTLDTMHHNRRNK